MDNILNNDIAIGNFFSHNPTGILNFDSKLGTYISIGNNNNINTTKGAAKIELQKTLENKVSCSDSKIIIKEKFNNYNYNNNNNNNILFILFLFLFLFLFLKKYLHII